MNALLALTLLASVVLLVQSAPPSTTYSTKYDHLDVDAIISNDRALMAYIKCLLDETPCATAEGREFRKNLPEALRTNCSKCTDAQKNIIRKLAKSTIEKHPKEWEKIKNKYDPKGEHHEAFSKFLKGE
ncbi:ejaculatory bulb-specific protein 3-like [Anabrus simplex]|uniref:ejaculatory bulb-specific protein 3-like n=1 Tax=Anabrus simplex TaxID=316456 RepID=UPI0035A2A0A1